MGGGGGGGFSEGAGLFERGVNRGFTVLHFCITSKWEYYFIKFTIINVDVLQTFWRLI